LKTKLKYLVILVFVIFVILLGYNYYKKGSRNLVHNIIVKKNLINILVAGRKHYHKNTFRFFAIVTLNTANKNIGVTFIPPQFKVDVGGKARQICDVEFSNFTNIRDTFKNKLKLDVPFFIKVYSEDVVRFVNIIEGMDIFSLDQAKCVDNIKFGLNYLDGRKIYDYLNCAEDNSIFIKYDRILDLIQTLYHNVGKMELIKNAGLISRIIDNAKTNLFPQEIFSILNLLKGKEKSNLYSTVLPGNYVDGYYDVDELSYKAYQQEFLTKIVVKYEGDPNSSIRIMNGTNVSGLARKLRNSLMRDGLNVVEFSTSPYPKMKDSIIISRTCDYRSVEKISEITGINKVYFVTNSRLLNNILIIIGGDMIK